MKPDRSQVAAVLRMGAIAGLLALGPAAGPHAGPPPMPPPDDPHAASLPRGDAGSEELPVPTFANSLLVSIEHNLMDAAEVDYIKKNFPWGLYAWLSFSRTALFLDLDWAADPGKADPGIAAFKSDVDDLIRRAHREGVHLHIVVCSGLARGLHVYRAAKEEDVRNAQWYNNNTLASDSQIRDAELMNRYAFGTLSRYARKVRRNLEAKSRAAFAFLKKRMEENPGMVIVVSGWGEAELNFRRIQHDKSRQEWFCDYSPFAVLEFRDWIRHAGLYGKGGPYEGQGFPRGGGKYRDAMGLAAFNRDFGTNFTTWDLKYFHWDLADPWGDGGGGARNPDPRCIPFVAYTHGGMMPAMGPNAVPGGFDPPRSMMTRGPFWDLWNLFRETMVHNFVLDAARWASEAGIPADRWYSHQIPGDYLFGTFPEAENKNARYYTSASPLWTADVKPYGSAGATIYDVKFPHIIVRSTDHALPAISTMTPHWAILEYDAETYPVGFTVEESPADDILAQFLKVYRYGPHLINFWRWQDATGEHRIKGMNKEIALRRFIAEVRDKARRTDLDFVFDPPRVSALVQGPGRGEKAVHLKWSPKIWATHPWTWTDWGDFSHFEILRGSGPDFPEETSFVVGTTEEPFYEIGPSEVTPSFYRVRAVNVKGIGGPLSKDVKVDPGRDIKRKTGEPGKS